MFENLNNLLSQTEYCLQNIHLQSSSDFLQQLTSKSVFLYIFPKILPQYPFLSCHLLCSFVLDGWEAVDSQVERDQLRYLLMEYMTYLCESYISELGTNGEKRGILIKCVTAWIRMILQEMKTKRTKITIDEFWSLFGVQKFNMKLSWNLRMPNESTGKEVRYAVLLALGLLPEESSKDLFSKQENLAIKHQLHAISGNIIEFLLGYLSSIDPNSFALPNLNAMFQLQKAALIALKKWIQFGVPLEMIYNERFALIIFSCLSQKELLKETTRVILESFQIYADKRHNGFITNCIASVNSLRPRFIEAWTSDDYETCHYIAQLVIGFSESQVRLIMEQKQNPICMQLIEFVSLCAKHPSLSICALTFDFWYSVQSRLSTKEDFFQFRDVFSDLLLALVDHSQFTTEDMYEDIEQFRMEAKDVFTEPFHVLFADYFTILYEKTFQEAFAKGDLSRVEATLFAIASISDIPTTNHLNESFQSILTLLPKINYTNQSILRRTVSSLIQGYSFILRNLLPFQYVAWSLNFLISGVFQALNEPYDISSNDLLLETARCFKLFCENCPSSVNDNPQIILVLIRETLPRIGALPFNVMMEVFLGFGYLCKIIEFTNTEMFEDSFKALFLYAEQNLERSRLTSQFSNPSQQEQSIANCIELLSQVIKPFDGKQVHTALISGIEHIWGLLMNLFNDYKNSTVILEALAELFMNIFIGLGIHTETLNLISSLLLVLLEQTPNHLIVKVIAFIIGEKVPDQILQIYASKFQDFATRLLWMVSSEDAFELQHHTLLIKYFYTLLINTMAACPNLLDGLKSIVEGALNLAIAALAINEREMLNQVIKWIEKFIDSPLSKQFHNEINGPLITQASKLIFINRSIYWSELSRILGIYRQKFPLILQTFLLNTFMGDEFAHVPLEDKKIFVKNLTQCTSNRAQLQIISSIFHDLDKKYKE